LRYYDTSVILSLYLEHRITEKAVMEVEKDQPYVVISDWTIVEVKSALAKEIRMKQLPKVQAETTWQHFYQDVVRGRYTLLHLSQPVMIKAHDCIELGGTLRAGDSLHIAIAWEHGRLSIVTADAEQAKAAKNKGLKVTLLVA
jgi:uncharacterized protein